MKTRFGKFTERELDLIRMALRKQCDLYLNWEEDSDLETYMDYQILYYELMEEICNVTKKQN